MKGTNFYRTGLKNIGDLIHTSRDREESSNEEEEVPTLIKIPHESLTGDFLDQSTDTFV